MNFGLVLKLVYRMHIHILCLYKCLLRVRNECASICIIHIHWEKSRAAALKLFSAEKHVSMCSSTPTISQEIRNLSSSWVRENSRFGCSWFFGVQNKFIAQGDNAVYKYLLGEIFVVGGVALLLYACILCDMRYMYILVLAFAVCFSNLSVFVYVFACHHFARDWLFAHAHWACV